MMFLQEKRTGNIKGRASAYVQPQRKTSQKGGMSAPTVETELVLITTCIDAMENCDVAIADVHRAFLTEHIYKEVHMLLDDEMADEMQRIFPKQYAKYVFKNKNSKIMIYVGLNKAVYGCLRVALLFYQKLQKELVDHGFVINNYGPCIANNLVEVIKITLTWHVDDLKISHKNPDKVTNLLTHLLKVCGEKFPVSHGRKHTYLGMYLDFSTPGVVKVLMKSYVRDILE